MANNYTEFSEELCDLTPEETTWLEHQLQVIHVYDGKEYPDDELPEHLYGAKMEWSGCRVYRDMDPNDYELAYSDEAGFEYEFDGPELWLHAAEWAAMERVGHLVQKFLKQFRPGDYWSLTYANTCEKPRVGEFGGGAMFVTAERFVWENAYTFVAEQEKAFKLRQDVAKLVERAEQAGLETDDLDEQVHDLARRMASTINNTGIADQIDWLVSHQGLDEVRAFVAGLVSAIARKKSQDHD